MDPSLARRAWNARYRTKLSPWLLGMVVLAFGVWVDLHDGNMDTVTIVVLSVLGAVFALFIAGYLMGLRDLRTVTKASRTCAYTLTDSTISLTDSQGSTMLNWTAMAEVHNLKDFVNVQVRGGGMVALPMSQVPAEALAYLVERSRANGAKIIGF